MYFLSRNIDYAQLLITIRFYNFLNNQIYYEIGFVAILALVVCYFKIAFRYLSIFVFITINIMPI